MDKIADTNRSTLIKAGLRSIAASIPVAGSLAQAWSEYESHTKAKRLDEFMEVLRAGITYMQDELQGVNESIRDDFPPLIERTAQMVVRETSARKRKLHAQLLLKNIAAGSSRSLDDKLDMLDTLDALTDSDLDLLIKVSPKSLFRVGDMVADESTPGNSETHVAALDRLVRSVTKLESRALVTESKMRDYSVFSPQETPWVTSWRMKEYEVLPFGKLLGEAFRDQAKAMQESGHLS